MEIKKFAAGAAAIVGIGAASFGLSAIHPTAAQARPLGINAGVRAHNERHPELARALRNLEQTEANLRNAAHDFGGHRAKAADLCHQAELEVKLAMQYDKK